MSLLNDIDFWKKHLGYIAARDDWPKRRPEPELEKRVLKEIMYFRNLVIMIMRPSVPRIFDYSDMVSFANVGVVKALKRYDPNRGYSFKTYALPKIKGSIIDRVRAESGLPRSYVDARMKMDRLNSESVLRCGKRVPRNLMIQELNISNEGYSMLMSMYNINKRISFEKMSERQDSNDDEPDVSHIFADMRYNPERIDHRNCVMELIHESISSLPKMHKAVIYCCDLMGLSQADVARKANLSQASISNIRKRAYGLLSSELHRRRVLDFVSL